MRSGWAWIRIIRASLTLLADRCSASMPRAKPTSRTLELGEFDAADRPGQMPDHDPVARDPDFAVQLKLRALPGLGMA